MKYLLPFVVMGLISCGMLFTSCKHNPVSNGKDTLDTSKCDTCGHNTTQKKDTTSDTTSHNFTWTSGNIPSEQSLRGCWVFGPNDIYAVGGSMHKTTDGVNWSVLNLTDADKGYPLQNLLSGSSMFAFTETDYWLTNGFPIHVMSGGIAKEYRIDTASRGELHTDWGTSSNDMFFVGDGGTILHFDGTNWTTMNSGTTDDITDIWGTSDQNIWAAGYHQSTNTSVLLHYDGHSWQPINLALVGNNVPYYSIDEAWTCDSAGHHKAYACGSLLYRNSDNANSWSNDSGKILNALSTGGYDQLNFIRGNASNDFMVEGGSGFVSHWNGASWFFYPSMYNYNDASFDTYAFSLVGNTACQVGQKNGQGWYAIGQRQ